MVRIELNIETELLEKIIKLCEKSENILNLNELIIFYIEEGIKSSDEDDEEECECQSTIKTTKELQIKSIKDGIPDIFRDVM